MQTLPRSTLRLLLWLLALVQITDFASGNQGDKEEGIPAAEEVPKEESQATERPNILLIITDEERYPPAYLPQNVKDWFQNLPGKQRMDSNGRATHFVSHRTSSTACSPSRATLYTGQMPSLHGVTQTFGLSKAANDPAMSWLLPKDVPTMGEYFRAAGYETRYIGKWHISYEDLLDEDGYIVEDPEAYRKENLLSKFGWDGWLGPEPHGASFSNLGWARDPAYVKEFESFLQAKEAERTATNGSNKPWVVALNLVNPHDIIFPDLIWRFAGQAPLYDQDTPEIPLPPTFGENLQEKPAIQQEYAKRFATKMFFAPVIWTHFLRFYAFLIATVDQQIDGVLEALDLSSFANHTVRVHTADHGDLQGAHGGMIQKWHQGYEEALHIPLVIQDPRLDRQSVNPQVTVPTQSLDVLPTLLSLAGLKVQQLQETLKETHQEVHKLPGRDLSSLMFDSNQAADDWTVQETTIHAGALTYFQLEDEVSRGSIKEHFNARRNPILRLLGNWNFNPLGSRKDGRDVATRIEGIVYQRASDGHTIKLMRYYDDPQTWSHPGVKDVRTEQEGVFQLSFLSSYGKGIVKTQAAPDAYEVYDVTKDPTEVNNLANDPSLLADLQKELQQARSQYRLERTRPLPPASERNAHMPAKIKEHMDIPKQIELLPFVVVGLVYSLGTGCLWLLIGRSILRMKRGYSSGRLERGEKLKET